MCHQVTLTVPGNNAAVCWVLVAVLHTTPLKENDTGYKSCCCWSTAAYLTDPLLHFGVT